jgi:hypothetical protein
MILYALPGSLMLGGSGIREAPIFRSAILADFEIRGSAISCFGLAAIALSDFFLARLRSTPRLWHREGS